MSDPLVSVIIPTYNGAAYLAQTLASIESQADSNLEVIAIDDGSTDATLTILRHYSSRLPLRIIPRPRVGNWVASSNHGLAEARGRYVCFLHQDDLWLPSRLRAVRQLLRRQPEATLIFHASRYIDTKGRWLGVWRSPLSAGRLASGQLIEQLLVQNFIAVPAPLFDRETALRVGGMDEALWYTADWDFWLKLAAHGPAVYHPAPFAAFRIHSLSQTAQGVARAGEMRSQIETVLNRHISQWEAAHPKRREVRRAALMSLEMNHALATSAHGDHANWLALGSRFLALGPAGWHRFFRDSRIIERLAARIRARA